MATSTRSSRIAAIAGLVVMFAAIAAPAAAETSDTTSEVVVKLVSVPYKTVTKKTSTLDAGTTRVTQKGKAGVRTVSIRVTKVAGVVTKRERISAVVTTRPISKIVLVGTRVSAQCDPNYGGCVPIASDVDCAGGSGNGPAYVSGPVRVTGYDIYGLDYDHDGWGCE